MKRLRKNTAGGGAFSKALPVSLLSIVLAASLAFTPLALAQTGKASSENVSTESQEFLAPNGTDVLDRAEANLATTPDFSNSNLNQTDQIPSLLGDSQTENPPLEHQEADSSEEASADESGMAANSGVSPESTNSIDVPLDNKNTVFYTVSSSDISCTAGGKAIITLAVYAKDDNVKANDNFFNIASIDIPNADTISFTGETLSSDVGKGQTATVTFKANIPSSAAGGVYPITIMAKSKKGEVRSMVVNLSVESLYQGVTCMSAKDAGSKLCGYAETYDLESLSFAFDLFNYSSEDSAYTWNFKLEASDSANGTLNDVTALVTPFWSSALPGAESEGSSGSGLASAQSSFSSKVFIDVSGLDPKEENAVYKATLTITDTKTGNTSEHSVMVHRATNDLSNHKFIIYNVGTKGGNAQKKTVYADRKGIAWLDELYYGNVANDPRVPFSDAKTLKDYLSSLPEDEVDAQLNKYLYDMFNTNSNLKNSTDYADEASDWPKDGNTPFHAAASSGVNDLDYSLADGGVVYDEDYFQNLSKTAQLSGREGSISISADAKPVPRNPRVYLIRTQGSWQMFDMAHALSDDGSGIMYSDIDQLATYYDLKQALLRFSQFLEEKSGGSVALGFLTFSHAGEYTMFTGNGYLSNDPQTIEEGLRGWDTFGDCEHSHYSDALLQAALGSVPEELANWKDSEGNLIASQVRKTAIFIGGPCEPTEGKDGYAVSLPQDLLASNMDHTYGIQTVKGTSTVKDTQGGTIQSWLDYEGKKDTENNRLLWQKDGNGFYVAPSEDDIFNALVDIYNKDTADEVTQYGTVNAAVTDTVQKEFEVTGVRATWTSAVDGSVVNVPSNAISVVENADGITTVTCDYGECKGTGTIKLDISVKAKDDYIGGNNDLTNVGVPRLAYSGIDYKTGEPLQFDKDFTDRPTVNVSLLDLDVTGGQGTHKVGQEFNLADHAKANLKDLLTGYPQTNGTLTLEWVETDEAGNVLPNQTITFTPGSYRIENGELIGVNDIALPGCSVNSDEVITRHFKLKATYEPDEATNGVPDVGKATAEADVTLNWVDEGMVGLRINKVSAGNKSNPLQNVGFVLYEDEDATMVARVYTDVSLSQPLSEAGVLTDAEGHAAFFGLEIGKSYYLKEVLAAPGYALSSQVWTVVAQSDSRVTINDVVAPGAHMTSGSQEYYQAEITIENSKMPSLPTAGAIGKGTLLLGGAVLLAGIVLCSGHIRRIRRKMP